MKINIVLIILSLFLFFCEEKNKIENFKSINGIEDTCSADRITKNAKIELTNGIRVTAIVEAGVIKEYVKQMIIADENLQIFFLDENKDTVSVLTADKGKLFPITQNMEASGNVVVTRYDGLKLLTDRLEWNNRRQLIFSKLPVRIEKGSDYLEGKGFETPADLEEFEIDSVFVNTFQDINFIRPPEKK